MSSLLAKSVSKKSGRLLESQCLRTAWEDQLSHVMNFLGQVIQRGALSFHLPLLIFSLIENNLLELKQLVDKYYISKYKENQFDNDLVSLRYVSLWVSVGFNPPAKQYKLKLWPHIGDSLYSNPNLSPPSQSVVQIAGWPLVSCC